MKKNQRPMPAVLGVGTASVIFIFMLLSLVTFAVLAYGSAASDYRLSRKAADRTREYYAASNLAQERIGEVDRLLSDVYDRSADAAQYMDAAEAEIEGLAWKEEEQLNCSRNSDEIAVSWIEKMNEAQNLLVSLRVIPPESGEGFYEVEQYRIEASGEWKGDTSVHVYGSDKKE